MALILVTDEAANAIRRKALTDKRLIQILNSNEEKHMPDSWEARWLAAFVLAAGGHRFNMAPKEKK